MRFTSTAVLLTSLAASIHAGVVAREETGVLESRQEPEYYGTFDTFTDSDCSRGGKGHTVDGAHRSGNLDHNVQSVKAYLPTCRFLVWNTQGGLPVVDIPVGNSDCRAVKGTAFLWMAILCD